MHIQNLMTSFLSSRYYWPLVIGVMTGGLAIMLRILLNQ